MARYRFYRNGDLMKSAKVSTDTGKSWIDVYFEHWSNVEGATVNRVSDLELRVNCNGIDMKFIVTEGDEVNL